jgi:hypothetical protein
MRRPRGSKTSAAKRPGGGSARSQAAAGRKQYPQPWGGREEANIRSQAAGRRQCPRPGGGREEGVLAAMRWPGGSSIRSQAAGREQSMQRISRAEQRQQPGGRAEKAPAAKPAALAPKRK